MTVYKLLQSCGNTLISRQGPTRDRQFPSNLCNTTRRGIVDTGPKPSLLRVFYRDVAVGGSAFSRKRSSGTWSEERLTITQQALSTFLELPAVPIGSYVSSPVSALHNLDPRVKQAWLAALLFFPANGTAGDKAGVCVALTLATAAALPPRVWRPQLTALASLCAILFFFVVLGADSVMPVIQPREPPAADEGLLILPQLENSYRYVLFHFGPLQVTRKGANLALNSTCLTFTVLQAAHLALCTTTPEAMAAGLRWYLRPLRVFSAPIDEIVFTVLLSLRFTSIVFEEIRNISLGLAARGVQWHLLGWRGTVSALSSLLSRTLESLFITSAALADAITARGYVSAEQHRLFSPANDARGRLLGRTSDVAALFALAMFAVHLSDHV